MTAHLVSIALLTLSVGLSAASVLRLTVADKVGTPKAIAWTLLLALSWGAWYAVSTAKW